MCSSLRYHDVALWTSGIFKDLRITVARNFGAVIFGLLSNHKCTLQSSARAFENGHSFNTNRQRMKRFFSWKNITLGGVGSVLIPLVFSRFPKRKTISIIIDTTSIIHHLNCLTAAVPWKGRAIPIAGKLYWDNKILSQTIIEEKFVKYLVHFVPKGYKVCIVADRGFGRVGLLQFLDKIGVKYVIRVKSDVIVKDETGARKLLRKRKGRIDRIKWFPNCLYRADEAIKLNITIAKKRGAKEAWYLATNLTDPKEARRRYEQRFQIEETFKDAKHQLNLEYIKLREIKKIGKMIAAILVAIILLILIGIKAHNFRYLADDKNRLSLVALALTLLLYPPPQFRRSCLAALNQAQKGGRF